MVTAHFAFLFFAFLQNLPTARDVCNDILFWDSEFILSFYQETSAIIKSKKCDPGLRKALLQIKDYDNWDQVLDKALVEDIKHHAKNITADLCGLIQGIRNKYTHRDEFTKPLKSLFGEDTTGLEAYFRYKFPRLLMDVYKVMKEHCVRGPFRQKYFGE
uniref:KEN domain-containing protein n=1 Tax=Lactuca sativa TaxID=4236 RepID=A0A9R1WC29_LACSA|nr:hypothetical protein LSAT_V11C200051390 [Lactuca sativa]